MNTNKQSLKIQTANTVIYIFNSVGCFADTNYAEVHISVSYKRITTHTIL